MKKVIQGMIVTVTDWKTNSRKAGIVNNPVEVSLSPGERFVGSCVLEGDLFATECVFYVKPAGFWGKDDPEGLLCAIWYDGEGNTPVRDRRG